MLSELGSQVAALKTRLADLRARKARKFALEPRTRRTWVGVVVDGGYRQSGPNRVHLVVPGVPEYQEEAETEGEIYVFGLESERIDRAIPVLFFGEPSVGDSVWVTSVGNRWVGSRRESAVCSGRICVTITKRVSEFPGTAPDEGATVELRDDADTLVESGLTDADGRICFENLANGDYVIKAAMSGGHTFEDRPITMANNCPELVFTEPIWIGCNPCDLPQRNLLQDFYRLDPDFIVPTYIYVGQVLMEFVNKPVEATYLQSGSPVTVHSPAYYRSLDTGLTIVYSPLDTVTIEDFILLCADQFSSQWVSILYRAAATTLRDLTGSTDY